MEKEVEVWKDIKNYEGLYQVSNLGNIKSLKRIFDRGKWGIVLVKEKHLKVGVDFSGYYHVNLSKNNKAKTTKVHRLVSEHFLDRIENKTHVNHKDNNKQNNDANNLEWVNPRENCSHREIKKIRTSNFIGVYRPKGRKKWRSSITHLGSCVQLGYFETEILAYEARVKYEKDNNIINKYL